MEFMLSNIVQIVSKGSIIAHLGPNSRSESKTTLFLGWWCVAFIITANDDNILFPASLLSEWVSNNGRRTPSSLTIMTRSGGVEIPHRNLAR
jgi:hypothetical protein